MGNIFYFDWEVNLIEWLQKAADLGDDDAMTNIGYLYEKGLGTAPDYAKAFEYYQKAADLGNPHGLADVAWMILTDLVPDPDYAKAVEYFTRSAESGMANPIPKHKSSIR